MNGVTAGAKAAGGAAGGAGGVLHKPPKSLVHTLFGLDVLQARPPADSSSSKKAAAGGGAPAAAAAASAAGPGAAGKDGLLEAQQFMQFFHLVPAQVRWGQGAAGGGGVSRVDLCVLDRGGCEEVEGRAGMVGGVSGRVRVLPIAALRL
jgi:hypothetical protein